MSSLKQKNLKYIYIGTFFVFLSAMIGNFFLPFFLKERGLTILEIGVFLTIGLALGSLIISVIFSKIQKSIKLKTGLSISSIFAFLTPLSIYFFPNVFGATLHETFAKLKSNFYGVAADIALQHNTTKNDKRKVSSLHLIYQGFAFVIGLILAVILIKSLGFKISFLIFALLTIPSYFLFNQIKEETRFKPKKTKPEKIESKLKWFLAADIIYNFALSASFALVITFLVIDSFSGSIEWIALLFIALYLAMTASTILTKNALEKMNPIISTLFGMILLLITAIMIIFSTNLYVVLGAMFLEGIGAGIWVPSQTAYYWKLTKPSQREHISGYFNGIKTFSKTIAPLFGAGLATVFGILGPFYLKAVLASISILIYLFVFKQTRSLK